MIATALAVWGRRWGALVLRGIDSAPRVLVFPAPAGLEVDSQVLARPRPQSSAERSACGVCVTPAERAQYLKQTSICTAALVVILVVFALQQWKSSVGESAGSAPSRRRGG